MASIAMQMPILGNIISDVFQYCFIFAVSLNTAFQTLDGTKTRVLSIFVKNLWCILGMVYTPLVGIT